jgi:hypothetical protein
LEIGTIVMCKKIDPKTVYLVEKDLIRPFYSQAALNVRGFNFKQIKNIDEESFLELPIGPFLY